MLRQPYILQINHLESIVSVLNLVTLSLKAIYEIMLREDVAKMNELTGIMVFKKGLGQECCGQPGRYNHLGVLTCSPASRKWLISYTQTRVMSWNPEQHF